MALTILRKGSQGIIGKVLLVVIGFSFAIWGVSNVFTNSNRNVAVVGGAEIEAVTFQAEYERTIQRLSNERGQRISVTQAKNEGIPQGVLANMIMRQSIENHAASLGVTTSDLEAIRQIKKIEAFNGIMGSFDEATFVSVLQQSRFSRAEFENNVRHDVTREQMINAAVSGVTLPRGMSETIVRHRLERRHARYVVLAPDLAGQIETPSDDVLQAWYESNVYNYIAPERRDISFIVLGPEDFTAGVDVSEENIQELYDSRVASYTTPETRNVERVFGSHEEMIAAKARIEAGDSFTSVGASLGLVGEDVYLADIGPDGLADVAASKAAFAADRNVLVGPIEGLSWSLVRVSAINPQTVTPFEAMRGELRDELILREADRTLGDQIDVIDEAIASGDTLENAATKVGLPLHALKNLDANGMMGTGGKPTSLPDDPAFLKEVFASVKNFDSDLTEFGDNHYFVVRVDEIYPSAAQTFEEVREDVVSNWRTAERKGRLGTLASSFTARAAGGEDFAAIGNEVGRGVLDVPNGLGKTQVTDLFSRELLDKLFSSKEGDFFHAPVSLGESIVVMQTGGTIPVPDAEIATLVDGFKVQLDASLANDIERQYTAAVQGLYPSKQNPAAISLAIGDTPQQNTF